MHKPLVFVLSISIAAICGCQSNQTDYQRPRPADSPLTSDSREVKGDEVVVASSSNNAGAVIATIGGAIAAPFEAIGGALDRASGHTPGKAARLMEHQNPDQRRLGVADLAISWKFAHQPPYTTRYKQIAQNDPDYTVRAMAIRALNIARDASATSIFIAALDDERELVRLEAAKALANVPDPKAAPALLRCLQGRRETMVDGRPFSLDEGKDVRIAAANALRHYRTLDVARTLVSYLNERDFAVAWQSRQSLRDLTGRDLNYDQAGWLQYLSGPEKPFG